jgi:hypothetical protein
LRDVPLWSFSIKVEYASIQDSCVSKKMHAAEDGKGRSRRRVRAQQMSPPAHVCLYNIKVIAN